MLTKKSEIQYQYHTTHFLPHKLDTFMYLCILPHYTISYVFAYFNFIILFLFLFSIAAQAR